MNEEMARAESVLIAMAESVLIILSPIHRDKCTEGEWFTVPLLFFTRRSCKSACSSRQRKHKKGRGEIRGLLHLLFSSVAIGADADAHAGNTDADPATFFITTTLDVPLTRSVVTVRVADFASFTAFTPAAAIFIANHADVNDVAVGGYQLTGSEGRGSGGGCEKRACAHGESDC